MIRTIAAALAAFALVSFGAHAEDAAAPTPKTTKKAKHTKKGHKKADKKAAAAPAAAKPADAAPAAK
jgi:hypothetical protein